MEYKNLPANCKIFGCIKVKYPLKPEELKNNNEIADNGRITSTKKSIQSI